MNIFNVIRCFFGHTWILYTAQYIDSASMGTSVRYQGKCKRCGKVEDDELPYFAQSGFYVFDKQFSRDTLHD